MKRTLLSLFFFLISFSYKNLIRWSIWQDIIFQIIWIHMSIPKIWFGFTKNNFWMTVKECQTACPTLWKSYSNYILSRIAMLKWNKVLIQNCCFKLARTNQSTCLYPSLANDESLLHFHFERDMHCLVCSLMETLWRRAIDQKKLLSVLEESVRDHKDFLELAAKEKFRSISKKAEIRQDQKA